MSNLSDVIDGCATTLKNNITGVHTFNHPPSVINEFPAAVILLEGFDAEVAFGGNTFEGTLRIVFLVNSGDAESAFAQMYDYVDPTVTNRSVIAAIRADVTLDGKVDSSDAARVENIGRRNINGGLYAGFDVVVPFIKSVA